MLLAILAVINIILLIICFILLRQIDVFNQLKKNYSAVIVLQKIMEILGKKISSKEKLEEINRVFLNDYDITFSTVVSYTGGEHVIKTSNVESQHHSIYKNLIEEPMFRHNALNNIPKYVTTSVGTSLKYIGAHERGIRSVMFLPLYLDGSYSGYWLLEDTRPNAFDRLEKVQLSILKNNLVLILENSSYQSTIEKMAVSDRLTGLYNRYYLYSKGRSIINEYPVSTIVIFDIDFFKKVNDTYGHDVGDKVLINVVQTTQKHLSDEDIFVRFGGEEFIILFPGKDIGVCKLKIDKIREIISSIKFFVDDSKCINVTVSYGMSTFQRGGNLDSVIKNADVAVYRAKQNGRNRIEIT